MIGSFLLDRLERGKECFAFKHHYITQALDSGILYGIFEAMQQKREAVIETAGREVGKERKQQVVPLRIFISVQNGRQYLMAYVPDKRHILSFRLDRILSVAAGEVCAEFDSLRAELDRMQQNLWGVSTQGGRRLERVEFTVRYEDWEEHIHMRLLREKRCGQVERIDAHTSRFWAEVYDASELIPWIRTFICRITSVHFSKEALERRFLEDLAAMYRMYGIGDGPQEKQGI